MKNEIVLYQSGELGTQLEVLIENDTVWLNRQQLATLFGRDVKTIGKHINNVFSEGELDKVSTVANFATVQNEGGRFVERLIEFYNLDVIISVGYRVKSKQGTQFRIWATNVLKDYLLKGYSINNRMNRIEDSMDELKHKVQEIDLQINSKLIPIQGIFFNGQIFDAYKFVSDLIRSAKKSVILIDNYIDDSVLTLFGKRNQDVQVKIYTKNITKQLILDLQKFNSQYETINILKFTDAHDRFLIIDNKEIYHIGASLKDLGKKWFAFSKIDKNSVESILNAISNIH
jgi:hypothetical protein